MRRGALILGLVLSLAAATPAAAEPGDLDPTFSGDGRVAALGGDGFVARAVAVGPDGRTVVAGYACAPSRREDGTCRSSGASSFRMSRYTADGGLDTEFGDGGVVTTAVGTSRSQAFDVSLAPDGRIVLAGVARDGGGRDGFALARYAADGTLDRSFGEQGTSIVPVGGGFAGIADLVELGGGALAAVGVADEPAGSPRFAVARYHPDGSLDGSFGHGGTAIGGPAYGSALAGAVSPSGDVTAAGIGGTSSAPGDARFALEHLSADGTPAAGFGVQGSLLIGIGSGASFANALVGLQDGRAVAAGAATEAGGRQVMAFSRTTADGRLDATWDGDGSTMVRIGDGALAADAARDAEGRLVAFGQTATGGADWRFALARLGADGLLDPGFGTGGVTIAGFPGAASARATAGALTPDGRIVAAGIACRGGSGAQCEGGSPRLALARFEGGGPTPPVPAPEPATNQVSGVQRAPFAALAFPAGALRRPFTVRIRVACLQRATCSGTLTVRTRRAYRPARLPGRPRRRARAITVAAGRVQVRPGRSRDATLRIRRTGRSLVRRLGRVPIEVSFTVRDAGGHRRTVTRGAVLSGR